MYIEYIRTCMGSWTMDISKVYWNFTLSQSKCC